MEKQPFQTANDAIVMGLMEHAESVSNSLREAHQGLND